MRESHIFFRSARAHTRNKFVIRSTKVLRESQFSSEVRNTTGNHIFLPKYEVRREATFFVRSINVRREITIDIRRTKHDGKPHLPSEVQKYYGKSHFLSEVRSTTGNHFFFQKYKGSEGKSKRQVH